LIAYFRYNFNRDLKTYTEEELDQLSNCRLCPRECGADRLSGEQGYCKSDAGFNISSICIHKGEEPVISGKKGICNIFFSHCNLQCIYCQNHTISGNTFPVLNRYFTLEEVINTICETLEKSENIVGFVSPSHNIMQVIAIIKGLHRIGRYPVFVYNTNGYDKVKSLRLLEKYVHVYLPDFKYMDPIMAMKYSQANNYPEIVKAAIKEMYRQKGATLLVNNEGIAESGIIIRHLILPGEIEQSIKVLKYIAEEISPDLNISLMSQYFPTPKVNRHPELSRTLTMDEYNRVLDAFNAYGFYRGWTQALESNSFYRPDFGVNEPFKD
jgi:putative pyruvate formate lyase activating enzyme